MTKTQNKNISIAVFIATCLVVLRHAFNLHLYYSGGCPSMPVYSWNIAFQKGINLVTSVAIPVFFIISGYLYFTGVTSFVHIQKKLLRRIKSLLVPYLLWNIASLVFYILLFIFFDFGAYFINTFNIKFDLLTLIKKISIEPVVVQFWYIRTLIIICCSTPVFFIIYKSNVASFLLLIILLILWQPVDRAVFSTEGFFFFALGGDFGYHLCSFNFPKASLYFFVTIFVTFFPYLVVHNYNAFTFKLMVAVLLVLFYYLVILFAKSKMAPFILRIGSYSFMIYALHAPAIRIINIIISKLFLQVQAVSFLSAVFLPILICGIIVVISNFLSYKFPSIYNILTGFRNEKSL